MGYVKNFLAKTSLYSMLQLLPAVAGIVVLKIYSEHLSKEEFGIFALITVVSNFVYIFGSLGLDNVVTRYFFDYQKDENKLHNLLSTLLIAGIGCSVLLLLIEFLFGDFLFSTFLSNTPITGFPLGFLAVLNALNLVNFKLFQSIFRNQKKHKTLAIYSVINAAFQIVGPYAGILLIDDNLVGIFGGKFILLFLLNAYYIFNFYKNRGIAFEMKYIKESFPFFYPIILYHVLYWGIMQLDQILLNYYLQDLELLSIYSMAITIALTMDYLISGINSFLMPEVNSMLLEKEIPHKKLNNYYNLFIILGIVSVAGLSFAGQLAIDFYIDPKFKASAVFIPIIIASFLFRIMYSIFVMPLYFIKKTKPLPKILVVSFGVSLAANVVLIPLYGIWGVIGASILGKLLQPLLTSIYSIKAYHLKYDWNKIVVLPCLVFLLVILGEWLVWVAEINRYYYLSSMIIISFILLILFYQKSIFILLKKVKL